MEEEIQPKAENDELNVDSKQPIEPQSVPVSVRKLMNEINKENGKKE